MGQRFSDIDDFPSLPPVTQLRFLMNVIARTQRDLARFHHEVKQILASHPQLEQYAPHFREPRLVVDHDQPSRCQRGLAAEQDGEEKPPRRRITRSRRRQDFEDVGGPEAP
jgi:hypothetical protein